MTQDPRRPSGPESFDDDTIGALVRETAGGWTMPDVSSPAGASGDLLTCQKSGPGKYRPSPGAKTMWGSVTLGPTIHYQDSRDDYESGRLALEDFLDRAARA